MPAPHEQMIGGHCMSCFGALISLRLFIVRNSLQTGLDDPTQNVLGGALPAQVVPKLQLLVRRANAKVQAFYGTLGYAEQETIVFGKWLDGRDQAS